MYHECRNHKGKYRVTRLIDQHGAEMQISDPRRLINPNCPKWKALSKSDQCGVYFPNLPEMKLFAGPTQKEKKE